MYIYIYTRRPASAMSPIDIYSHAAIRLPRLLRQCIPCVPLYAHTHTRTHISPFDIIRFSLPPSRPRTRSNIHKRALFTSAARGETRYWMGATYLRYCGNPALERDKSAHTIYTYVSTRANTPARESRFRKDIYIRSMRNERLRIYARARVEFSRCHPIYN